ncbi:hypothetical protein CTI12_AA234830 [Artemisia annua]|uniref:Uncharacterized protein n=1 Tax=Artemisia annua TaxID=35608 RepID=A0A2U1NT45_ARTAN|nr:hypothetical protein CTI12_AA234830 [Artemisia annua]
MGAKRKSVILEDFIPCKKQLRVAVKTIKKIVIENDDDEDDEKSQCSSVGSNDPVYEVIYLDEEDEVESTSKGDNDVRCDELSKGIIYHSYLRSLRKRDSPKLTNKNKKDNVFG